MRVQGICILFIIYQSRQMNFINKKIKKKNWNQCNDWSSLSYSCPRLSSVKCNIIVASASSRPRVVIDCL